ncbi:nicotinamide N-methyltransferase-like isoform X2 [Hyperolius riggenbachi]|uniref:nicotinamide N-methyltransferase-like isoform X2 n=1 Tax=Hyperolius riggenbachi TaxID=752182 RepID=UPI0035A2F18D
MRSTQRCQIHTNQTDTCSQIRTGKVQGETLIDIGSGPAIHPLLSACEAFTDIICTDLTDRNREELEAWLTNQPEAFDWSTVVKHVCQLEGDRITWGEKEDRLRKAIKQVLKCDVMESNPTDPVVLPQADCILSCLCLESACKDHEAYTAALNNMTTLLKPGGHLVMAGVLGGKCYMVGEVKFLGLSLSEAFIRESLSGAGYITEKFESSGESRERWEKTSEFSSYYVFVARKNAYTEGKI